jgi:hypothetical protein
MDILFKNSSLILSLSSRFLLGEASMHEKRAPTQGKEIASFDRPRQGRKMWYFRLFRRSTGSFRQKTGRGISAAACAV